MTLDKRFSLQSLLQSMLLAVSILGGLTMTAYRAAALATHVQEQHEQIMAINAKILDLVASGKCR